MNPFAQLLGLHVANISVESERQEALRFGIRWGGKMIYVGVDADCCSETWFADIFGVQNLLGNSSKGIELLDNSSPAEGDERSRQEEDQIYGVRLLTAKGHCDIIYRNSSNGYYGGSAEPMDKATGDAMVWTAITEDWQA